MLLYLRTYRCIHLSSYMSNTNHKQIQNSSCIPENLIDGLFWNLRYVRKVIFKTLFLFFFFVAFFPLVMGESFVYFGLFKRLLFIGGRIKKVSKNEGAVNQNWKHVIMFIIRRSNFSTQCLMSATTVSVCPWYVCAMWTYDPTWT